MNILIFGATGFIGTTLVNHLAINKHHITIVTRNKQKAKNLFAGNISILEWNPQDAKIPVSFLRNIDVIVNLAGENIASKYWTKKQKQRILSSRVQLGTKILEALKSLTEKPQLLIQASATGYYGYNTEHECDEKCPQGKGFLAYVSGQWEKSTENITELGIQRAVLRTGIVLGKNGGMFPKLLLPIKLFMGSNFGKGNNYVPWIHLNDEVGAIEYIIENMITGTFNLTAPNSLQSKNLNKAIAVKVNRPLWLSIPRFIINLVLGSMAKELLLSSQYIIPNKLIDVGYKFKYPTISKAIDDLLDKY